MDYHISSKDNRIYKDCVRLGQKKHRDKEGRYLIEGRNLLREAVLSGADLETVIIREDFPDPVDYRCRVCSMDRKLFDSVCQTETSQGIFAIVRKDRDTERFFRSGVDGGNLLVLDQVQDPGNIGTMIRTAEGAGYQGIICVRGTGDIYSPKVIRAAAGSLFRMRFMTQVKEEELPSLLKELGKKMVVTAMDGMDYREAGLAENVALVIGNEGNGVSDILMDQADIRVSIPMQGQLESLNASVAAGILMYEATRN